MSVQELFTLLIYVIKPIIPYTIIILLMTFASYIFISIKGKGQWINKKSFALYSIFFELDHTSAISLACVWVKFWLLSLYIVGFQELDIIHYFFFMIPCLLLVITSKKFTDKISSLVNCLIQFVGILALNIFCSYILKFDITFIYILFYVLSALIVLLYSIYIFIGELDSISLGRSIDINGLNQRVTSTDD